MDTRHPRSMLHAFRWYRRSRLWVVPTAGVDVALALAVASPTVDTLVFRPGATLPVFTDTARVLLPVIATAVTTLTARFQVGADQPSTAR